MEKIFSLIILFLPLIGSLGAGLLSKLLGKVTAARFPVALMGLSTLAFGVLCLFLKDPTPFSITLFRWLALPNLEIDWSLSLNPLSIPMTGMILLVSLSVHIYSLGYMAGDSGKVRFLALISFFTFMMLFFVMAGTTIQLFLGWEGIGLCSYLLIGFWSEKEKSKNAALKALLMNRVGDVFLLLAFGGLFVMYGTVSLSSLDLLFKDSTSFESGWPLFFAFCLLVAAAVKSAQLGAHPWLLGAMEGPTPVSALIHAATLVTAGVFLLLRFSSFLELFPVVLFSAVFLGGCTAVFGGVMALFQRDLKRIIAYSTCSQLGYMFLAAGLQIYHGVFFHLMSHAFFKSLLFLGAGAVIHCMGDIQDITLMGQGKKVSRVVYGIMVVGFLSLAAVPPFAGFFSKELIVESLIGEGTFLAYVGLGFLAVATLLTSLYSMRVMMRVFHRPSVGDSPKPLSISFVWTAPLIFLSILSLCFGVIGLTPVGLHWLSVPNPFDIPGAFSMVFIAISLFGICLAGWIYRPSSALLFPLEIRNFISPLWKVFSFETFYSKSCVVIFSRFASAALVFELWLHRWGFSAFGRAALAFYKGGRRLHTGFLPHGALSIMIGLLILLGLLGWEGF